MGEETNEKGKTAEMVAGELQAMVKAGDFAGVLRMLEDEQSRKTLFDQLSGEGIKDALRNAAKDRLQISIVEWAGFGKRPAEEALKRVQSLFSLEKGKRVISPAWGMGKIAKAPDYFYRKVTVDFKARKGHQLSFDAAYETLQPANDDHILVVQETDPERVKKMLAEDKGEFVKAMLTSFGDMSQTRLEILSDQYGFVPKSKWKDFWTKARGKLRDDPLVEIPTRATEPLHLKKSAEQYDANWFAAMALNRDPKAILSSVKDLEDKKKIETLDEGGKETVRDRLVFAMRATRGSDDALYARLAFKLNELKLDEAMVAKARSWLWADNRFLAAAREMPVRDLEALVRLLTETDPEANKKKLFAAMESMPFALLSATLEIFKEDADCEETVAKLLARPDAPATLVTLVIGRYKNWEKSEKLPHLTVILTHAIALGEGRQSGEKLTMQNRIRKLFADKAWLKETLASLKTDADRALFFERFQASTSWDHSAHGTIVNRMLNECPALKERRHAAAAAKPEIALPANRTSRRMLAKRRAEYEKLVNELMPQNAKALQAARELGDLRENFEYQSAKEQEKIYIAMQSKMSMELSEMKEADFTGVATDVVRPGTMVEVEKPDGSVAEYAILGEWDNEPERGILSFRTPLAQSMIGKAPGEALEMNDAQGNAMACKVKAVKELSEEIRSWMNEEPAAE